MIYVKSVAAGLVASIVSLIVLGEVLFYRYRSHGGTGEVGINILAPLPLAVILVSFAAGFYLVFRRSR